MTRNPTARPVSDPVTVAADARSALACPATVDLVVDGVPDVLEDDEALGMQDLDGTAVFTCRTDSATARAALAHRSALLTIEGGVLAPGAGRDTLTLAGRLEARGIEDCVCCGEVRQMIALEPTFALLARSYAGPGAERLPERQFRVPLDEFRSPAHQLNRGFLRRSVEHANDGHQVELRQAVATLTSTRAADVIAVSLAGLTPIGVEVHWLDPVGGHVFRLAFDRPARTTTELGELLRDRLHAGIC